MSYFFSRRALRPIDRLKEYIASGGSAELRFAKDEIGYLAEEFDQYRTRIEASLAREREFSADASHELRTPLTVLRTTLELLESKKQDTESTSKIATMNEAIDEMEDLINKLLLLERGLADGAESSMQVSDFFSDFLTPFKDIAHKKDLNIILETPKKDFLVRTSRERLEHVFGNLIRNALHYTEQGAITVRVTKNRVDIIDTGVGMSHQNLMRIWDRFYRSDRSRNGEGA